MQEREQIDNYFAEHIKEMKDKKLYELKDVRLEMEEQSEDTDYYER